MLDPTGDIPWDEEPDAGDVVHVASEQVSKDRYLSLSSVLLRNL